MKFFVFTTLLVALLSGCLIDSESKNEPKDPEILGNCVYVDSVAYCTESSAEEVERGSSVQQETVDESSVGLEPREESSSDYWYDEHPRYSFTVEEMFPTGDQCIGGFLWDTDRDFWGCVEYCNNSNGITTKDGDALCMSTCEYIYDQKDYEAQNKDNCMECTGFIGRDAHDKPLCIDDCDGYIIWDTTSGHICVSEAEYEYDVEEFYTANDTIYNPGSCRYADTLITRDIYDAPVYQPYDEYLALIVNSDKTEIETAGKIYAIDSLKFVVDTDNGVHVYNTSDVQNPVHITFIVIPGVKDVAVKNNTLLADSYSTLLAIDITDPSAITVLKDIPEVLQIVYDNGRPILTKDLGLIVGWEKDTVFQISCKFVFKKGERDDIWYTYYLGYGQGEVGGWDAAAGGASGMGSGDGDGSGGPAIGMGGSLARFAVSAEYLYAVTDVELVTFWIKDETDPKYSNRSEIGWWGIETVYMKRDLLFVGSRDAMYIYDISNPGNPKQASRFSHVTSCDPVVVEGDYAYVTLRTGNGCNTGDTELEILDVSDIYNPYLLEKYEMHNPAGLGIWDNMLYICDGSAGLKVYDITATPDLTLVDIIDTIEVHDLIVNESGLTLIGEAGMYQYDHSDPANLELLSFIPAE